MTSPIVERFTHVRQEHPEGWCITAVATPQGEFVRYSDYERLSAELARAREVLKPFRDLNLDGLSPVEALCELIEPINAARRLIRDAEAVLIEKEPQG